MPLMGVVKLAFVQICIGFGSIKVCWMVTYNKAHNRVAGSVFHYLAFHSDHAQFIFDNACCLSDLRLGKHYRRKSECKRQGTKFLH
ncbi:hypothetical protein BJP08_01905 [Corynebacterium sp. NML140438]|nr:hypothetical protein BJP08_01905 [Corynebacterium sp. NML140438]